MKNKVLGAALAVLLGTGAASASGIKLTYQSGGLFGPDDLGENLSITAGGNWFGVKAGLFHMNADNSLDDFLAFCVDIEQFIGNPQYASVNNNLFDTATRDNVAKLFSSVMGGASIADAITTSEIAAGFQVALWEVVYDSGEPSLDLSSGFFKAKDNVAVTDLANSYLQGLPGGTTGGYQFTYLESEDNQDLLTATPVPLPASALLLGFGLAGLAGLRRRKNR